MSGSAGPVVAVVGPGRASPSVLGQAEEVGRLLGAAGATIVCGGLGGVMEAACRGARAGGGRTVGLLPGTDRRDGNRWLDVAIPTGLGEARNVLVVRAADGLVAVAGEYGTLTEIAFALKLGLPVVGLSTWELWRDGRLDTGVEQAADAASAVRRVLERIAAA